MKAKKILTLDEAELIPFDLAQWIARCFKI
jgi:hypothetical protein